MSAIDPEFQALLYFKDEQYRAAFCKLPMVLMTNEKYADLTNNARVAYALLISRFELSYQNDWIDDSGAIYFYYTAKKMAEDIHVSERTAIKVRQELAKKKLLNIQRQGLHKPARLYLLKPVIDPKDFNKIDALKARAKAPVEPTRNELGQLTRDAISAGQAKTPPNQDSMSRRAKSALPDMQDVHAKYINTNIKQDKPNLDTKKPDTLNSETIKPPISDSSNSLDVALKQYADLDQDNSVFSAAAFNLLKVLAQNYQTTPEALSKIIFKAKDAAFHEVGVFSKYLDLKDFPHTIEKALYRVLKQAKAGKIKNLKSYIYMAFLQEFNLLVQKYLAWCQAQQPEGNSADLRPQQAVTEAMLAEIDIPNFDTDLF
ncbi:hypothetical protein FC83_GL001385 [Agrilactobacillus composti DSM 18527 = JCM 14202]|uniref:Replication initiator A N-terminal domain-containing protein n=1 Tax=Agrilactobacillus composti DSM 18527 = JCM 14202 TaxID=1423734 RepID=A0A0R1XS33_9LACO|nr:replication initiator protein A [Agrilactobacillus composti]KRM30827.1 hypothetical protein FC83_GL001385 [Agrilactobacillus composti DSM 18527 = JCM 14202]